MRNARVLVGLLLVLSGCAVGYQARQNANRQVIARLTQGMLKDEVQGLMPDAPSFVESFVHSEGGRVDVLFYYTNRRWADGNDTRDETTPLVFVDDRLVGWGETFLQAVVNGEAALTARAGTSDVPVQTNDDDPYPRFDDAGTGLVRLPTPSEARSGLEAAKAATIVVNAEDRQGSGFIITRTGVALTNAHVVGEEVFFSATLPSGRQVGGRVLRKSEGQDIALVQVLCADECMALAAGSVSDLEVGEDVMAVGAPLGLSQSVASGIVSGLRLVDGATWVQTDTPLNAGNSGGPLIAVNSGKVVGISTWGVRKSIAEGMNFALSIDDALVSLGVLRSSRE